MLKTGNICYVELSKTKNGLLGGKRPCLIIEGRRGGFYTPYVTAIPITSEEWRYDPTVYHYEIKLKNKKCYLLLDQLRAIHRSDIKSPPITKLTEEQMEIINDFLKSQLNL